MSLIADEFYRVVKVFGARAKNAWWRDASGALSRTPTRGRLPKGQLRASTSEFFEIGSSR
jgi:hypothetical protein